MKYLVNKNACYIITHDEIDVQRLQDRGCMFFLTEHDMYRHASIACGLDMEDVRGSEAQGKANRYTKAANTHLVTKE